MHNTMNLQKAGGISAILAAISYLIPIVLFLSILAPMGDASLGFTEIMTFIMSHCPCTDAVRTTQGPRAFPDENRHRAGPDLGNLDFPQRIHHKLRVGSRHHPDRQQSIRCGDPQGCPGCCHVGNRQFRPLSGVSLGVADLRGSTACKGTTEYALFLRILHQFSGNHQLGDPHTDRHESGFRNGGHPLVAVAWRLPAE